ncbi:hypothetical protein HMPREF0322_03620 [Desulfitobacterium hafniense DP7]|uniref:Uncharacterized protein n=1 Tax=Desulfitobacterium hafniense DP7 TaxID=537010 RepID=G9XRM1_DESHA|nr:hypothetical protein HMPREF0322_03620 [Desulfitobacterium hafniense DP7]
MLLLLKFFYSRIHKPEFMNPKSNPSTIAYYLSAIWQYHFVRIMVNPGKIM